MMSSNLSVIKRKQKAFTLLELVVAMSIATIISLAVASLTYQTVKINARSANHQLAVSQLQNAVNSLSRDTQQAQNVYPKNSSGVNLPVDGANHDQTSFNLITSSHQLDLHWVDWNNVTYDVIYKVNVNNQLTRTVLGVTTVVSNNVTTASGNWDSYYKTLTFTLQTTVGAAVSQQAIESRTIQIIPRSAQ
jgi:prepilin-type N-terminal cleavage/methylation domain-containing protein